jgi:hypothetical protein
VMGYVDPMISWCRGCGRDAADVVDMRDCDLASLGGLCGDDGSAVK